MMHPRTFVAQTTCAHVNHFYRSVIDALEFDGPAIVCCYTTCQPEHGVADNMATDQARLAVDTRAFPLLIYDPRKGGTIRERLSLQGNPAVTDDWWTNPKTGQQVDFIDFCRSEGRFSKHFDKEGNPSDTLLRGKQDRLENWKLLQELAGVLDKKKPAMQPAKDAVKPAIPPPAKEVVLGERGGLDLGTRIKYRDGDGWVPGIVSSIEPAVLKLSDGSEIRTTINVLLDGLSEGLIVRV
jgi:hypothetical protein